MTYTPMRSALILLLALLSSAPAQESQCPTLTRAENDVEGLSSCRCGKELRNVTVTPPKGLELPAACSLRQWETDGYREIPKSRPVNLDSYDSRGNSLDGRYYFSGHLRLKGILRFEPSDGGELFFYPTAPVTMPKSALEPSFRRLKMIPNGQYTTYSIDQRIRTLECAEALAEIVVKEVYVIVDDSEEAGAYPTVVELVRVSPYKPCTST